MKFNIVGTVYYADGFDFEIEAETEAEARKEARARAREIRQGYTFTPELQEICIEMVRELP